MSADDQNPRDATILAGAETVGIAIDPAWLPSVRTHLDIALRFARMVDEFPLPDELEPANIYRA
jgi:hypothetical protein